MSGWQYLTVAIDVPHDTMSTRDVYCSRGKKALGGGVAVPYPNWAARVIQTAPAGSSATGWLATVGNDSSGTLHGYVWVICANVA